MCRVNHDALAQTYGPRLSVFELHKDPVRDFRSAVAAFRGHIDGLNSRSIEAILAEVKKGIRKVFVDGSNLGAVVKAIKTQCPRVQIYTFFHNVEAVFFWGAFQDRRGVRALGVAVANYLAERTSVKCSDVLIALSDRDSLQLGRIYGREASHVAPMAVEDKLPPGPRPTSLSAERIALFVGTTFYANRAGIAWYVREVAPRIKMKTFIVGRGFERFRSELELPGKVEVVGAVERLSDWYAKAHVAIAPIFGGSGMKTKVAEALMFGKRLVGTPEAFAGYESLVGRAGWLCASADDFVRALTEAETLPLIPFDEGLRRIYEEGYSFASAKAKLAAILGPAEE